MRFLIFTGFRIQGIMFGKIKPFWHGALSQMTTELVSALEQFNGLLYAYRVDSNNKWWWLQCVFFFSLQFVDVKSTLNCDTKLNMSKWLLCMDRTHYPFGMHRPKGVGARSKSLKTDKHYLYSSKSKYACNNMYKWKGLMAWFHIISMKRKARRGEFAFNWTIRISIFICLYFISVAKIIYYIHLNNTPIDKYAVWSNYIVQIGSSNDVHTCACLIWRRWTNSNCC